VAQARVTAALNTGYDRLLRDHAKWWARFWSRSRVSLPDPDILRHYYLVRYFYGAASRRGAPPMPLQGVWSADAGSLPPWKGDYHNDLNTQMTYMGYQGAGHFNEGATFLDMLWELLPTFRQFAREFYDAPGAAVPGVMSLKGQALGGWGQYSLSPTMGAWNAHLFYLHWRYTGDTRFLRARAYPFCREIGDCLLHLLKADTNGVLKLPLSSSPEIFDNSRRAFLAPNSNYDLASLRMLFLALAEMASAAGRHEDSARWANAAQRLGGWHVDKNAILLLDEQTPLPGSHRHLSNLMGLYPFNLITAEGGQRDCNIIEASLRDWDSKGTGAWCGYSFSWMAALRGWEMPNPHGTTWISTRGPLPSGTDFMPMATRPGRVSAASPTARSRSKAISSRWPPSTRCCSKAGAPGQAPENQVSFAFSRPCLCPGGMRPSTNCAPKAAIACLPGETTTPQPGSASSLGPTAG
jgi:alpha-L-fucosidase 2